MIKQITVQNTESSSESLQRQSKDSLIAETVHRRLNESSTRNSHLFVSCSAEFSAHRNINSLSNSF